MSHKILEILDKVLIMNKNRMPSNSNKNNNNRKNNRKNRGEVSTNSPSIIKKIGIIQNLLDLKRL